MNKTLFACILALATSSSAIAAEIVPVNMDGANVGLNDPTPATSIGGNPGTTIGEQRRIVYQFAADLWGAVLQSDAEIRVEASFVPLSCTATSGTLGSAGTITVYRDFPGAPLPGTWYHAALANAIVGTDLNPAGNDIRSRFNANLGTPGCLQASGWYYGLDGRTPAGRINFLDVVMHEIGHGLGFAGFDSLTTGAFFAGFPNVYGTNVYDNASGLSWNAMTNEQRVIAAKADALVWTGAEVTSQVPVALNPLQRLAVSGTLVADYAINPATYGVAGSAANFNGDVVLVNDGAGLSSTDACEPMAAGSLAGQVAMADRGNCTFKTKTLNAQNAGATAVIVANNVASGFPGMGDDTTITTPITIPSVGITQADGNAIKAALPGVHAALFIVPGTFTGSDANSHARLYAPSALAPGSSFSHYDVTHVPNAIMEPAINSDLDANLRLDLTPALYADEGWSLNPGNARIGNCTTNVDVVEEGGLIVGANVQAWSNMCLASTPDKATYQNCMEAYKDNAVASGVLTGNQGGKVVACAAKIKK